MTEAGASTRSIRSPERPLHFFFSFPAGDNCFGQPPGFIDGLAYDEGDPRTDTDDSLWLSDDAGRTLYHLETSGGVLQSFPVLPGRCNTGIAIDGQFLWLVLLTEPSLPPYDIVRVERSDPSTVVSSFRFGTTARSSPEAPVNASA